MPDRHEAVWYNTQEPVTIVDDAPLRSAAIFKFVSDKIWDFPHSEALTVSGIESVVPPDEALTAMLEAVEPVSAKFADLKPGKPLELGGMRGEKVTIPAELTSKPLWASVSTYNWDQRFDSRQAYDDNGNMRIAKFTDGHFDYARELSSDFRFTVDGSSLVLRYVMQRYQYDQAFPTHLSFSVWFSDFAETGYEGNSVCREELTEAQETNVLQVIARMGGITIDPALYETE